MSKNDIGLTMDFRLVGLRLDSRTNTDDLTIDTDPYSRGGPIASMIVPNRSVPGIIPFPSCLNEVMTSPAKWSRTRTPVTARSAALSIVLTDEASTIAATTTP
jgi:hypothetical protein